VLLGNYYESNCSLFVSKKREFSASKASMYNNLLYLAVLSLRQGAPVLIWPQPMATERSEIKVSSVSPDL